jgi:hypothetical protein
VTENTNGSWMLIWAIQQCGQAAGTEHTTLFRNPNREEWAAAPARANNNYFFHFMFYERIHTNEFYD